MKKILVLLAILLLIAGCTVSPTPTIIQAAMATPTATPTPVIMASPSPTPTTNPTATTTPMPTAIRLTGKITLRDEAKYDQLQKQWNAESDANFKQEYAKGEESYNNYRTSGQQTAFWNALFDKYWPLQKACYYDSVSVAFSGNYMVVSATGSTSKSVDGITPIDYLVNGNIVSCSFQKQERDGSLKVQIIRDGKIFAESETTADYGVVTAATN